MVLRNLAKIVIAAGEAVGKAFTRAVKEELNASKQAAERYAASASSSSDSKSSTRDEAKTNARIGITLQESMQILDVKALDKEQVEKRFKHLFEINEKEQGGTLYLQSKVYRAKERIDAELQKQDDAAAQSKEQSS
ncbi:Mitochondrial import inner membrane translocase subunit tim-16 [Aphelenchoides bicaudatus]|nr:Mitochondrial import inner membrane translocase subunit tim-16 [Aphelenchoides bicaudatus]